MPIAGPMKNMRHKGAAADLFGTTRRFPRKPFVIEANRMTRKTRNVFNRGT